MGAVNGLSITRSIWSVPLRFRVIVGASLFLCLASSIMFFVSFRAQADALITPPDTCFALDSSTGTITDYYNNESNNTTNPTCSRALSIPSTIGGVEVKTIGNFSFSSKQITAITIPNSATSIGDYAFAYDKLASVTVPNSVTSIGDEAFSLNSLTDVTIPTSVQTLSPMAFSGQNPVGGDFSAATYDSIWYTRLHIAGSVNPYGLSDGAYSENAYYGGNDNNNNGTLRDSLGGAIINPATVTVRYVDTNGNELKAPE